MNNLIWLIRASRWARNPPSRRMVMLVFAIVALGLTLLGLEHFGLWPDWATLDNPRRPPMPRL
ncbi:hypothetical protein FNJ84_13575 [Paracoccus sp. M683]|uniref:hypothetical protein n=1 Tax=Paracoccus sp. M683 TaxID=2594268 RepID=UPI00117DBF57|nr:hypothetical protein [Paracoccus sp. M683]TRW96305.1 hypothetical protein FNJ84_13575 [Paracoccus sp. M683]